MDDFSNDYGYQDYTTASIEAQGYADQAWQAGDMDAYNQWSTTSWDAWNTSTDLYVGGADSYGLDSPSTSEGYFPGTETSSETPAVDAWSSYSAPETTDWSATTTDSSWASAPADTSWTSSTTDSSWASATTDSTWSASTDTSWSAADTSSWSATADSSY